MLEIRFDANNAIAGLRRMRKNVKRAVELTLQQQGKSAKIYAKSISPVDKGVLRAGIAYQATNTRLKVISQVPGTFPYNKWVNQDPGFAVLGPYNTHNRRFGIHVGQSLVYGKSPSHWRWSGTPGYMNLTYWRLRKNFPLALRRRLSKTFR